MKRALLVATTCIVMVLLFGWPGSAWASDTNQADYWTEWGGAPHPRACYKHTGNHNHGTVNGSTVTLVEFDQEWFGDHWELLVVKGGSVDSGFGPGNAVYVHPSAGVAYAAPLNAGGQQSAVSHWIVCKGRTPTLPSTTTTTTTTPPETTWPATTTPTSTSPPDTTVVATSPTSTVVPGTSPAPTTTAPPDTSTTTSPAPSSATPTTSSSASSTTSSTGYPTTTGGGGGRGGGGTLPKTGSDEAVMVTPWALGVLALGVLSLLLSRRRP